MTHLQNNTNSYVRIISKVILLRLCTYELYNRPDICNITFDYSHVVIIVVMYRRCKLTVLDVDGLKVL